MNYPYLWSHFVTRFHPAFMPNPGPARTVRHLRQPLWLGGSRRAENTLWMTPRESLHAHALMWKSLPYGRAKRRYARGLLARLNAPEMEYLRGKSAWLLRALAPHTKGSACATVAPTHTTLYHVDGRTAAGDQPSLAVATGLDNRRVRDLVCGRRSYASGWATTPQRAALGHRGRGRPKRSNLFW